MNILIASGSFKDVYDPVEACDVIRKAMDPRKNHIVVQPICDGGEYTYDILKQTSGLREVFTPSVYNAYLKPVKARYLTDGKEAHIVSSELIRLFPEEDALKNPLKLSDYGVGQLVLSAIREGYRNITLYIGGTSTVGGGMGFAQALGIRFFNASGQEFEKPLTGEDLTDIARIDRSGIDYSGIRVRVVADGDAKSYEMSGITALKVSNRYTEQKEQIVSRLNQGIDHIQSLTGISPDSPFTGAAGGLRVGIDQVFKAEYVSGGTYFSELFDLEKKLKETDLVLTGEGRFDNTACGKAPAYVAEISGRYQKPVYFICGQLAKDAVSDYRGGIVDGAAEKALEELGIKKLFTCQEFYDHTPLSDRYPDNIQLFRVQTPKLLKELFQKENL